VAPTLGRDDVQAPRVNDATVSLRLAEAGASREEPGLLPIVPSERLRRPSGDARFG
jgi:hypothetical protein